MPLTLSHQALDAILQKHRIKPNDLAGIDRLCTHYMGGPYSARDQQRVNAWIEVESWYAWNGGAPWH